MDIVSIVILIVAIITVLMSIKMVDQGWMYTVERFGRYTKTIGPGINFIVPVVDKIGRKQNIMEQVLDVHPQEVISRDNAMVTTDAVCFFQVIDAVKASYEVNDLERAMQNLVMTNIRAVLGSMELDEMLSSRDRINMALLEKVDEATDPWGVKVTRIEIRDITPPRDLVDSMANQMKAERDKRAAILVAQGVREAEIQRAEGEKQAEILRAEGARTAAFLESEAREREAEAEAKATRVVSESIAAGDINAINYFVAQKYTQALTEIGSAENSKVVLMPLEASSLIGSLDGIKNVLASTKE
ncbi:SPFH domain-containing protein [Umboniibacter marinipuniceus]|uniref:Protein QmcA n=1 Tax=Umboniibacter marinipuniceus TaxID=569599 RepID=A0A3M0ADS0_9GAMM|nr:SPFH domain-containing protein [Umboniibacter marinipuniceus]RMA82274.1 SPFH domain-containing protein [Umboniibacter marinipuniceus]